MSKIHLNLGQKTDSSHEIIIENGLLKKIPQLLAQKFAGSKVVIISDSNVAKIYGNKLMKSLEDEGLKSFLFTFPQGEQSKNLQTVSKLIERMLKAQIGRLDLVIALGGGVTGDIAGFASSIYMRGIKYIHIPTSLLAMVDSCIGGKTGVDCTLGKNLIGTFYQPKSIYIDPELLSTLNDLEFSNGFAEIIKYGIIKDYSLFCLLEKNSIKTLKNDKSTLNKIIIQSCKIKAAIIEKDEKENNERMILNYGHTMGHAIEKYSNYKIKHGTAISIGSILINKISLKLNLLNKKESERIKKLYSTYELPGVDIKMYTQKRALEKIWSIAQNDKKMLKSKINFIIANSIGKTIIYDQISKEDFIKILSND